MKTYMCHQGKTQTKYKPGKRRGIRIHIQLAPDVSPMWERAVGKTPDGKVPKGLPTKLMNKLLRRLLTEEGYSRKRDPQPNQ